MLYAITEGFRAVRRSWGLVALLLGVNLAIAALLAVPFDRILENDLGDTASASRMMYGFDYSWWSRWSDARADWTRSFAPDIFGAGFAFKNVDLLLRGEIPARLFVVRSGDDGPESDGGPGAVLVGGLGLLYLFVQTFLTGGVLSVLRSQQGSWTLRGLLHGAGFYFGRFLRLALLALLADYVLFRLNAPFASWADRQGREAVSEATALAWSFGRHGLLLLAILFVHLLSCYAKVITVIEERSSAVLAFLSSLSFCVANLGRTAGHYLSLAFMGVVLLALWSALDGAWGTVGYRTQIVTFVLMQTLVAGRIALRVALLGGQVALYRQTSS